MKQKGFTIRVNEYGSGIELDMKKVRTLSEALHYAEIQLKQGKVVSIWSWEINTSSMGGVF